MLEVPFHRPSISSREEVYLLQALWERYWGGGRWVERLESHLSHLYGRPAVVVSSSTAALHLALSLLLGEAGGEVIVPTWTFTATASEVVHAGGVPVLADVGASLHLTAETVEPLLTPRTRGIIVMHYAGEAAPMEELMELCQQKGLWLLEDTCHAVPGYYGGQLCGTFGAAATLSFHATKPIAAGQGGAILLADALLAERARQLRQHGIRRLPDAPWLYEVEVLGYNYMLSDFQAAVALAQAERLSETWQARRHLAEVYQEALADLPSLNLYPVREAAASGWHLFPVFWRGASVEQRDALLRRMRARGFALSLHYKPLHLHAAYRPYVRPGQAFPQAERAYAKIFSLPLWPDLAPQKAQQLVDALKQELLPRVS